MGVIMFCSQCGTVLADNATFCNKCGASVSNSTATNSITTTEAPEQTEAIWNPNAAACWSLIFSPAFSSYLHALNWRALGKPGKQKSSMAWFYTSLAMLGVFFIIGLCSLFFEFKSPVTALAFIYLLIWYYLSGKKQADYVKEKLGSDYNHRKWTKPLLIALGILAAYFLITISIGFAVIGVNPFNLSKGGYPTCTSGTTADHFKNILEGSPNAEMLGITVLDVIDQKKISETKDGDKLVCQADLVLSNLQIMTYELTFQPAQDGYRFTGAPVFDQ